MEASKVDTFMIANMDKFPSESLMFIRKELQDIDENKLYMLQTAEYKDPTMTLVLSLLLGNWGVDRFYLGQVGLGILKLFTCGGFLIWYIIDIFYAKENARKQNYSLFIKKLPFVK